jgi:O-antigen ligase
MTTDDEVRHYAGDRRATIGGLRFAVLTTRNSVFLLAVLAMNFTLMRPSPVDLLYVLSLLISLAHLLLFPAQEVSKRAVMLILLVLAWMLSAFVASMPWFGEDHVIFEIISKTFAISIGVTCAVVSMTWTHRNIETFMRYYIASTVISSLLGTMGFLTKNELLTWDGRAKGLIDDPNMYGSFLVPAVVFCAYFLSRGKGNRLILVGALAVILLGILLSLSRIAIVAAILCLAAYLVLHYRHNLRQLFIFAAGVTLVGAVLFVIATLVSAEFAAMFSNRLTLAQPYDLGEQGRYGRYLQVLPMIAQNPVGVGVLQLEKIFPEPIHNIWLSSFVNYGWGGGIAWVTLAIGSIVVSIRNYRRTGNEIAMALLFALLGVVMCATLHEGEHWRQMWMLFGLIWGINAAVLVRSRRPQNRVAVRR